MSKKIDILGNQNIPTQGALIVLGRRNLSEALYIEQLLSGRKVTWLCEENVVLDAAFHTNHEVLNLFVYSL